MKRAAMFSECGYYRYQLTRIWDPKLPAVVCIGLNPSTANEHKDDPTIRRLTGILSNNGYGTLFMLNLFALITPYPGDLRSSPDPLLKNDKWLAMFQRQSIHVIFCWGNFPMAEYRSKKIIKMFPQALCFGKNKNGSPKHPLYLKNDTQLIPFV